MTFSPFGYSGKSNSYYIWCDFLCENIVSSSSIEISIQGKFVKVSLYLIKRITIKASVDLRISFKLNILPLDHKEFSYREREHVKPIWFISATWTLWKVENRTIFIPMKWMQIKYFNCQNVLTLLSSLWKILLHQYQNNDTFS